MSNATKEKYLTIAEKLAESVVVNEGIISASKDLYDENLPKGIKPEVAEKVNMYNIDFLAATAKVTADLGVAGEDNEVSASFTNGHQQFEHLYQKSTTIAGEEKTNYLTSSIMFDLGDTEGAMAKVQSDLAALVTA